MIDRYTRPAMGRIWKEENKYSMWLAVETAASETLAEFGIVPAEAARAIRERGGFDLARIQQIEAEVRHDVIAFTTAVAEKIGPEARWLHYGLTSNDVVDTAQALAGERCLRPAARGHRALARGADAIAHWNSNTHRPSGARTASTPSQRPSA